MWEPLWEKLCTAQRASLEGLSGWDWVNGARRILADKEGQAVADSVVSSTLAAAGVSAGDVTIPTTPGADLGPAPLPPGWEWGSGGVRWTGDGPEPPELPPGWEWGPLRPGWTGEGHPPVRQKVIGTSGRLPCPPQEPGVGVVQGHDVFLGEMLRPGHAFVYQIYGIYEGTNGEEMGYLSEPQCLRFSPPDPITGEDPKAAKCGGCRIEYTWLKKTPITLLRNLSHHATNPSDLDCMLPEGCIALSVLAHDVDILKQMCIGCTPDTAVKKIDPIAHDIRYSWTLAGPGKLLDASHCTVFYQLPPRVPPDTKQTATIQCHIANVGGKAQDDPLDGHIKFEIQEKDSTHCLTVSVLEIKQPEPEDDEEDCEEKTARDCNPVDPKWEAGSTIDGKLDIVNDVCPGSYTILKAEYRDDDLLTLKCKAKSCGEDEEKLTLNDPLIYAWSDGGAGGTFPFGKQGKYVLYQAPADTGKVITFHVTVTDSRTQYKDPEKQPTDQAKTRQLLRLASIDIKVKGRWSNITVGHPYKLIPRWTPATAKVQRIEWKLDLGGSDGLIEKVLCGPGLTPDEAALKFTTQKKEKDLEVAWRLHTHTHGVKTLRFRIYGEACGDCCVCADSSWSKSDFMGRDPLADDEFRLFFEKLGNQDDGRVRSLQTVAEDDEYGEKTKLHTDNCANWFLHWSTSTYGTCQHDHKNTDPTVSYEEGRSIRFTQGGVTRDITCNGVYVQDVNTIWLTDGAAEKTKRGKWKSNLRWIGGSEHRWIKANGFKQRAFDLKGHAQCNRVYLHEYGHYVAMTLNWRPGKPWHKSYGPRSVDDTQATSHKNMLSRDIEMTLVRVGNYRRGKKAHGQDIVQKYNVSMRLFRKQGSSRRLVGTLTADSAWIEDGINGNNVTWRSGPGGEIGIVKVRASFEIRNPTHKWIFKANTLTVYRRANDPDGDFIPNEIEDRMGLRWDRDTTHTNHKRSSNRTSGGHPQLPDQEFFADQYAFDRWNLVDPGNPDMDWANPGAQSDPEYE